MVDTPELDSLRTSESPRLKHNTTKRGQAHACPPIDHYENNYCFSSIASSVWVAEVTIGVPGPKIFAAPAA